jgi:hypothetical protein
VANDCSTIKLSRSELGEVTGYPVACAASIGDPELGTCNLDGEREARSLEAKAAQP